jgi:hypothetical protein
VRDKNCLLEKLRPPKKKKGDVFSGVGETGTIGGRRLEGAQCQVGKQDGGAGE